MSGDMLSTRPNQEIPREDINTVMLATKRDVQVLFTSHEAMEKALQSFLRATGQVLGLQDAQRDAGKIEFRQYGDAEFEPRATVGGTNGRSPEIHFYMRSKDFTPNAQEWFERNNLTTPDLQHTTISGMGMITYDRRDREAVSGIDELILLFGKK